jgi:flagellar biosynthesis/type III secretory pathway M-ring protein FliF/YscJ
VSSDTHTVGYVFLWFVIPLLLVLGVDVLVVRRRERKNAKRKQQEEEMKSKELKTENPKIEEQE